MRVRLMSRSHTRTCSPASPSGRGCQVEYGVLPGARTVVDQACGAPVVHHLAVGRDVRAQRGYASHGVVEELDRALAAAEQRIVQRDQADRIDAGDQQVQECLAWQQRSGAQRDAGLGQAGSNRPDRQHFEAGLGGERAQCRHDEIHAHGVGRGHDQRGSRRPLEAPPERLRQRLDRYRDRRSLAHRAQERVGIGAQGLVVHRERGHIGQQIVEVADPWRADGLQAPDQHLRAGSGRALHDGDIGPGQIGARGLVEGTPAQAMALRGAKRGQRIDQTDGRDRCVDVG